MPKELINWIEIFDLPKKIHKQVVVALNRAKPHVDKSKKSNNLQRFQLNVPLATLLRHL